MRSSALLLTVSLCLGLALLGCSKPPAGNGTDNASAGNTDASNTDSKGATGKNGKESKERKEAKREPLIVPGGTTLTVSLGSALGSKLNQAGQIFTGSVAKDVVVGKAVAIPQGATVSGTVTDAKPLGKFAGGAVLQVRLDSINLNGSDLPVQAALNTFSAKGKGKRTAVLAGGGKGAAIGMAAGGGAGGAALTGNKDIILPAESAVAFELSQPLELRQ